eukprot:1177484-Prorocentrum_minimum.AAC.2
MASVYYATPFVYVSNSGLGPSSGASPLFIRCTPATLSPRFRGSQASVSPLVTRLISRTSSCVSRAGALRQKGPSASACYLRAASGSRAFQPLELDADIEPLLSHSTDGELDSPPKYVRTLKRCQS